MVLRLAILFLLLSWAVPAAAQPAVGAPSFFGTVEVPRQGLQPFPKWTGALHRHFEERARTPGPCEATRFNQCHWQEWQALIARLRDVPPAGQLAEVNRYLNRAKYITDPINWNMDDYWATPGQFFVRNGDCEDYAIAKFLTLRQLGWPAERLRLAVLQDLNLKIPHAVLIARLEDGRQLVLDNQIEQVVEEGTIRHYRPVYSLGEDGWWLHRAR
jgi:predicted transglutaminase-like cysteine proteinase